MSADGQNHDFATSIVTGWIKADFGAGSNVTINHVTITGNESAGGGLTADPSQFDIQYSDTADDAPGAWTTAWTVSGQTNWTTFQRQVFTRPGYTDPAYTGSPHGSHRYWRILMLDEAVPYYGWGLAEVQFRGTPGGPNLATGGTALESRDYGSGYVAANAFDGDASTVWAAAFDTGGPSANDYIGYDFGAGNAVSVAEVMLQARGDGGGGNNQAPALWMLQYSDDAVTWTTANQFSDYNHWGVGESRTYTDPLYVAP